MTVHLVFELMSLLRSDENSDAECKNLKGNGCEISSNAMSQGGTTCDKLFHFINPSHNSTLINRNKW